ncbi:4-hydroxybenzoate 3-monooxygenase [Aliikangiella sp. IMCC44359]|uniref:4-hydroxybenzoate 3-monooxygenase n=1 Tax=Aliikangiella sp. IMCC44359 TaxID=3459125 RepID=UPI00403ABC6F
MKTKTQVCIIGAGPSGLILAHILQQVGIDSIILEKNSRNKILNRVRAGIIDQNTIDVLKTIGFSHVFKKQGVIHEGFNLIFDNQCHRIDVNELTGGRSVALHPQQEIVKDFLFHRESLALPILFNVSNVTIKNYETSPQISFNIEEEDYNISADFVIGCDGYHGVSRATIPKRERPEFFKDYPFSWLGILTESPRVSEELTYASHNAGFALISSRSPKIQRMYLQCPKNSTLEEWDDERVWSELELRTASDSNISLIRGEIIKKDIVSMRSFVCEKMQAGRLYLVGDAAHIVPPSAAKGLNLAVSDVCLLSTAIQDYYQNNCSNLLNQYEGEALKRFWRGEEFSNFATRLFHKPVNGDSFDIRQQTSALRYMINSRAASKSFAENYSGIPQDFYSNS